MQPPEEAKESLGQVTRPELHVPGLTATGRSCCPLQSPGIRKKHTKVQGHRSDTGRDN
jgi:hypothetical protein